MLVAKKEMITKAIHLNSYQKTATNSILGRLGYPIWGIFLISFSFYLYFLGNTIFNVIGQNNYDRQARIVRSSLGELELTYLSQTDSINPTYAKSAGFVEPKSIYFAHKGGVLAKTNLVAQNVVQ